MKLGFAFLRPVPGAFKILLEVTRSRLRAMDLSEDRVPQNPPKFHGLSSVSQQMAILWAPLTHRWVSRFQSCPGCWIALTRCGSFLGLPIKIPWFIRRFFNVYHHIPMKYIEISWNGNLGAIIIFRQTQMLTAWWLQPTFFVSIGIWRWSKDSIVDGLNVIEPTNQWRIICYFMLLLGFDWCAGNQRLRIPRMLPLCHSISWHVSRDDRVPVSSVSTLGELWCVLARFICGLRRAFSATQAWSLDPEAESVEHDFANFGINSRQNRPSPLMCEAWCATGHDLRVRSPKVQQNFCGVWFCRAIHLDSPPWWYSMPIHAQSYVMSISR